MRASLSINLVTRGFLILGVAVVAMGPARAQEAVQTGGAPANAWQSYDWLKPAQDQQRQAASGETFHASAGQDVNDPFAVLSTGSLWQEKYGADYTRRLADTLSLSCQTSTVVATDDAQDISHGQEVGLQFQPVEGFTFRGDLHDAVSDAPLTVDSTTTGAGCSAESHLPLNAVLTLGLRADRTSTDAPSGLDTQTNAYDAQWKQGLGALPLTAILKGHSQGPLRGHIRRLGAGDEPSLAGAIAGVEAAPEHHDPGGSAPAAIPGISRRGPSAERGALCRLVAKSGR